MLINQTQWPAKGGWRYRQPETGWSLPKGLDKEGAITAIIKHRAANPRFRLALDRATVWKQMEEYICKDLKYDPQYCVTEKSSNFPRGLPSRQPVAPYQNAGSAVDGNKAGRFLQNAKIGIKTYLEWFGDGQPVTIPVAEERAAICLKCPHNEKGGLLERFTQAAAKEIMGVMGVLKDLNLHTSREADLYVCSKCDCPLAAKVFAPLPIVLKHMRPETVLSLPDYCWIRKIS